VLDQSPALPADKGENIQNGPIRNGVGQFVSSRKSRGRATPGLPRWVHFRYKEKEMLAKPLLIATLAAGLSAATFTTQVSADPVGGAIVGGAIGAAVGGPPGAAVGAVLGTAIGHDAYVHGYYGAGPYYGYGEYDYPAPAYGYAPAYAPAYYGGAYYGPAFYGGVVYSGHRHYYPRRAYYYPRYVRRHYAPRAHVRYRYR
jgi:hypothetical protein